MKEDYGVVKQTKVNEEIYFTCEIHTTAAK